MKTLAIALPLLAAVGYGKVVPVPPVPYFTPIQQEAVAAAETMGKAGAGEARQQLLELMQQPAFRSYLTQMADSPKLANMQPEDILTNIGLQYQAAEVVHNFHPYQAGPVVDVSMNTSIPYKTFFQEWQLSGLGISYRPDVADQHSIENWNEVNVYKFPNFTTTTPGYVEASNRIIYGALNLRKLSTGNFIFGNVSVVFKNSRIRNTSTIFGVDTGMYANGCGPEDLPSFLPGFSFNCSAFQPPGTFTYWEPTVLGHVLMYNITSPITHPSPIPYSEYPEFNMAYLTATFLNEDYANMPPIINRLGDFIEANPAINAQWDTDVKMIILSFRSNMFGTGTADTLRQWAVAMNWVLVWGNDNSSTTTDERTYHANQRIVDPFVLGQVTAGKNVTTDPSFADLSNSFSSLWNFVNLSLARTDIDREQFYWASWNSAWDSFKGTILEVQPLTGTSCANNDCAVVRVIDKKCICE